MQSVETQPRAAASHPGASVIGRPGKADTTPSAVARFFRTITGSSWSLIAVLASLAISIVSFKTTFQGMTDYLGAAPPFGIALSFLLTFGVQSLLFIVSWLIAFALFERHYLQALSFMGIFLISMAVSVAFSFVDLYDGRSRAGGGVIEAQEAGRMGRATSLASDTILALRQELDAQREQIFETFREQESFRTFKATEQRIRQIAVNPPADIAAAFRRQLDGYRAERDALVAESNRVALDVNRVEQQIAQVRTEQRRLQAELTAFQDSNSPQREEAEAKIARLEPRVVSLERQIQNEIAGQGSRYAETVGQPGCGRVCRELQDDLNPLKLDLEAARILVQTISEREQALRTAIDARESRLVELNGQRRELSLTGRSGPAVMVDLDQAPLTAGGSTADRLAWLDSRIALFEGANNPIAAISTRMVANIDAFEKRQDFEALDEAIDLCRRVATMEGGSYIRQGRTATEVCPSAQDNPIFSILQSDQAQRTAFDNTCGGQSEDGLGQLLARQRSPEDMYDVTMQCIQDSGLRGAAVEGLWADLRNKMQRWSPTASKTDKAYTALIEDKETAALVSFILALVMDSLVLLVAVGGRQMQAVETMHRESITDLFQQGMANLNPTEADSVRAKSIKLFLKGCHFRADGSGQVNLEALTTEEYRLAISTLHMLMANRQAYVRDENQPSIITLTKSGHRRLVTLLQSEMRNSSGLARNNGWGDLSDDGFWLPRDSSDRERMIGDDSIFRGWPALAANDAIGDTPGTSGRPLTGTAPRRATDRAEKPAKPAAKQAAKAETQTQAESVGDADRALTSIFIGGS
ncbi:MAG: hypothetical protein ACFB6R_00225 [Alphaproteobacteria bacterium]